jgi:hypothetical protein
MFITDLRTPLDIDRLGIDSNHFTADKVFKQLIIFRSVRFMMGIVGAGNQAQYLIISTPESDAGMVTKSAHIIPDLLSYIFHKRLIKRGVGRAGEFEIHPNQNTHFVTGIEQFVFFII